MGSDSKEIIQAGGDGRGLISRALDYARTRLGFKELNLLTARSILQRIVDTNENSINESTDLSRLGPYSAKDMQIALRVVAFDVFYNHEGNIANIDDFFDRLYKDGGIRWEDEFFFAKSTDLAVLEVHISSLNKKPSDVAMWLKQHRYNFLITAQMPITHQREEIQRFYAGVYVDRRPEYETETIPYGEFQIEDFRKTMLGLRWMAYNLLNWDIDFRLPEELEPRGHQLPSHTL